MCLPCLLSLFQSDHITKSGWCLVLGLSPKNVTKPFIVKYDVYNIFRQMRRRSQCERQSRGLGGIVGEKMYVDRLCVNPEFIKCHQGNGPVNQRKLAEHRWFRFLPLSRRLILSNAQNVDRSSKSVSDFLTLFFSNISDVLPHFANNFLCLFFFFSFDK